MTRPLIVIGVPTRNEARSIAHTLHVLDEGAGRLPDVEAVIVVADGASDDGTVEAVTNLPTRTSKHLINGERGATGKGANVLRLVQFSHDVRARALALFDADVASIEPHWLERMVRPALEVDDPLLVTPLYTRNRFEANTTNHIVYPLLRVLSGRHIRQPIAGEFVLNSPLIEASRRWPLAESTFHYGIDAFLTANALREGHGLREVKLTRKIHGAGFPKILFMSQQVLDTLFRIITTSGARAWPSSNSAPSDACRNPPDPLPTPPSAGLVAETFGRVRSFLSAHERRLLELFPSLQSSPQHAVLEEMSADAWCGVLLDAWEALDGTTFYEIRDALVALYLCRVAAYWREIERLDDDGIDSLLVRQADLLAERADERGDLQVDLGWHDLAPELAAGPWAHDRAVE